MKLAFDRKTSHTVVQAKKFVESVPVVMKEDAKKEEADEMKKKLETLGAKVDVE